METGQHKKSVRVLQQLFAGRIEEYFRECQAGLPGKGKIPEMGHRRYPPEVAHPLGG